MAAAALEAFTASGRKPRRVAEGNALSVGNFDERQLRGRITSIVYDVYNFDGQAMNGAAAVFLEHSRDGHLTGIVIFRPCDLGYLSGFKPGDLVAIACDAAEDTVEHALDRAIYHKDREEDGTRSAKHAKPKDFTSNAAEAEKQFEPFDYRTEYLKRGVHPDRLKSTLRNMARHYFLESVKGDLDENVMELRFFDRNASTTPIARLTGIGTMGLVVQKP